MEKSYYSNAAKKMVVNEIINMLYNNVVKENHGETFVGWCEDGETFELVAEDPELQKELGIADEDIALAKELMQLIAPHVDRISEIVELDYEVLK